MSETIGQRIRRLREERGLSAASLAKNIGIRENALYKIESGDTKQPSLTTGIKLAAVLGVDPWFLAFGRSRPSSVELPPEAERDVLAELTEQRGAIQGLQIALEGFQGTIARLERLADQLERPNEPPQ